VRGLLPLLAAEHGLKGEVLRVLLRGEDQLASSLLPILSLKRIRE
jgi:hypothetical protein